MGSIQRTSARPFMRTSKRLPDRLYPGADKLEWWPKHARKAFANLGRALGTKRLTPDVLQRVSRDGIPSHRIAFGCELGAAGLNERTNIYTLEISGSSLAGQWRLPCELLERLARAAARPS